MYPRRWNQHALDGDCTINSRIRQECHSSCSGKKFQSIAFPLIGAGSGSFNQDRAKALMLDELNTLNVEMKVKFVVFTKAKR